MNKVMPSPSQGHSNKQEIKPQAVAPNRDDILHSGQKEVQVEFCPFNPL